MLRCLETSDIIAEEQRHELHRRESLRTCSKPSYLILMLHATGALQGHV